MHYNGLIDLISPHRVIDDDPHEYLFHCYGHFGMERVPDPLLGDNVTDQSVVKQLLSS